MRTPLLPLLCVLSLQAFLPRQASAQIPHAGFEDWATNGSYADPEGWTSFESLFGISSNSSSGLFSAHASPENNPVGTATR